MECNGRSVKRQHVGDMQDQEDEKAYYSLMEPAAETDIKPDDIMSGWLWLQTDSALRCSLVPPWLGDLGWNPPAISDG